MEQVHLKYGTSAVDFEIDGAKSVKYLYENKMRVIEDIKADGSTWMYKLEAGSWDGAEYIKEDRIISLA